MTFHSRPDLSEHKKERLARDEYLLRAIEFAARGEQLPQTKLTKDNVIDIKSALVQRENLRQYINENLTNKALAHRFNVHHRTIEKIASRQTWFK